MTRAGTTALNLVGWSKIVMPKPINLEDRRPHLTICGTSAVHVFPLALFEDIVSGKLKPSEIKDIDDFLPQIIKEWMERFDD